MKTKKNKLRLKVAKKLCSAIFLIGVFILPFSTVAFDLKADNIIKLTNQERIKADLDELIYSPLLTNAAFNKANEILETETFNHTINGEKFSKWIRDVGYEYSFVGENLAIDFATAEGVTKAWMDSKTHKENILNDKFQEIGVAVVDGVFDNKKTILVVQIFGTPLNTVVAETEEKNENSVSNLGIRVEDEKIIILNNDAILSENNQSQVFTNTIISHPLFQDTGEALGFSILFAIIISSLVVSVMIEEGKKVKKSYLKMFQNRIMIRQKKKRKSDTTKAKANL